MHIVSVNKELQNCNDFLSQLLSSRGILKSLMVMFCHTPGYFLRKTSVDDDVVPLAYLANRGSNRSSAGLFCIRKMWVHACSQNGQQ